MFRFAMRAGRVWGSLPAAVRLLAVAGAVVMLLLLSVGSALAGDLGYEANPFRWR